MNNSEKPHPAGARRRPGIYLPDVTVAAVVMHQGRLLMVEELVRGKLVINQPAGHLEPRESLSDAMVRECREETGWEVNPVAFLGVYQWVDPISGRQFLRTAFIAEPITHDAEAELDAGIARTLWLSPAELRDCAQRHRSPLVLRVAEDFLDGRSLPLTAATWLG